jgi:hypothetical protein
MIFSENGKPSGTLVLTGDAVLNLSPDIQESPTGVRLLVVSGGLTNQWKLTLFATATEPALVPLASFLECWEIRR